MLALQTQRNATCSFRFPKDTRTCSSDTLQNDDLAAGFVNGFVLGSGNMLTDLFGVDGRRDVGDEASRIGAWTPDAFANPVPAVSAQLIPMLKPFTS